MGVTTGEKASGSLSLCHPSIGLPPSLHPMWPLHSPSPACHDQQLIRSKTLGTPVCTFFFFLLFPFGIFQIGIFYSLEFPRVEAPHFVVTCNDSSHSDAGTPCIFNQL